MLISTKTHPPPLKPRLLDRRHLIQHLDTASQRQLIMITGPAGYGKTSLAIQWINHHKPQVAWYSLDETDNDPDLFLRYFMTALITAEKGFEEAFNPLILDNHPLKPDDVIPLIIHTLNTFQADIYLVMDDFHLILNDVVHSAIIRFLNYLPTKVHIIILSRHKLPQAYSRAKYHYDTEEITPDDLKLTDKEANDFFRVTIPLELTQKQIRELLKITGGWVTGFQIFGLSQKNKRAVNQPHKLLKITGRESIDYLINEVVGMQSDQVKTFLSRTAVLYRFNTALCQYVTGDSDSQKILTDLYRQNLFLIPLGSDHAWYRYHHLFSEAVREWSKIASPGLLEKTRKKAAVWCAENEHTEAAFQYAFASGDFEFMADLLENHLRSLIFKNEIASALRWMSKIPKKVFMKRPILRLIECSLAVLRMRLTEVSKALPEIEEQFNVYVLQKTVPREEDCRDILVYLNILLDCQQNMFDIDISEADAKLTQIARRNKPLAGYCKMMTIVMAYVYRGDLILAEEELNNVMPDICLSKNPSYISISFAALAAIQRLQGRLRQSEKTLFNAYEFLKKEKMTNDAVKSILHLQMVWIFSARNDLDKALEYALQAIRSIERVEMETFMQEGYYLLANIWMTKGNLKKAAAIVKKSKSLSESHDYPSVSDNTEVLIFGLSMRQGNMDVIEKQIEKGRPDPSVPFSMKYNTQTILYAISLLHKGELAQSRQLLEALRTKCVERNILEIVLTLDILLSGICFFMGEPSTAEKIIIQAIQFSEKEGHISPFANNSSLILPIFTHFIDTAHPISQSAHFKLLLKACEGKESPTIELPKIQQTNNPFLLTKREIEILGYISDGYRNDQIADMAFISLGTVKTHIHHIFKKLNVQSRTQAALKAKRFLY